MAIKKDITYLSFLFFFKSQFNIRNNLREMYHNTIKHIIIHMHQFIIIHMYKFIILHINTFIWIITFIVQNRCPILQIIQKDFNLYQHTTNKIGFILNQLFNILKDTVQSNAINIWILSPDILIKSTNSNNEQDNGVISQILENIH